jgi:hypothetical protein
LQSDSKLQSPDNSARRFLSPTHALDTKSSDGQRLSDIIAETRLRYPGAVWEEQPSVERHQEHVGMVLSFICREVRTKDAVLELLLAAIHRHRGRYGRDVLGSRWRARNGRKRLQIGPTQLHLEHYCSVHTATPPRGLRRPPHKTYRTCQLTRRVDTVDDGDVLDSVLWGEGGDDDDNLWS